MHKCKELGDKVIVGLNTDEFVTKYKGKPPLMSYLERYQTLMATGMVDEIIANEQQSGNAKYVIKQSGANLIVIGSDWAVRDYVGQLGIDWGWLDGNNIGVCYLTYTPGISTTKLKERLANS